MTRGILAILLITCWFTHHAFGDNGRVIISLNDGWMFHKGTSGDPWEPVTVPHTYNALDPFDDQPGYYRGDAVYRRTLTLSEDEIKTKKLFLHFEAVNQVAEVYVNGKKSGEHRGGYTAFSFDITSLLAKGQNQLEVRVSNEHNPNIVPLKGDFNFYGGIYRDVWLIGTNSTHFDLSDLGTNGVYYDYLLSGNNGQLSITSKIISDQTYDVHFVLQDASGKTLKETSVEGKSVQLLNASLKLDDLHLWDVDDPYLYSLVCTITGTVGDVIDQVVLPVGFRTIRFDPNYGCFINDKPVRLNGVNRHQDAAGLGSALTNEMHVRDIEMIKSLGATFLRTAHYPQDPAVLDACDRLGIVVSMEIPIDHDMTNTAEFKLITTNMMREMIRQNRHHPSIAIWAYMNEMFLGKDLDKDKNYIQQVVAYAKELNATAKREDPSRNTMIANHGGLALYTQSGMTSIPDIVGWNLYQGWYENDCHGFGKFVDSFHQHFPAKPIIVTEFGAGSDIRIRNLNPERFDYSIEWQNQYFDCIYRQIKERTFLAGTAVWNMFDFGAEARNDAIPHLNQKGLCAYDRAPKDAYYVVKSQLSSEPVLNILSPPWISIHNSESVRVPVQVASNKSLVDINVNGERVVQLRTATSSIFMANLREGNNKIVVESEGLTDSKIIEVIDPTKSSSLAMNMGAPFSFTDTSTGVRWFPEIEISADSLGVSGGYDFRPRDRGIGTDRNILNTEIDPIYQTARIGIKSFRWRAQPGDYEVELYFAEPEKESDERLFDVTINGKLIAHNLDVARAVGKFSAYSLSASVNAPDGIIDVRFRSSKGEPILNAIQINKK